MKKRKINYKILAVCFLIVYGIAFLGSVFTEADSSWYDSVRPSITPPNFVFPIVWNILFFLIAVSLYLAWTNSKKYQKKPVAFFFGANLLLNFLWSVLFFGLQKPLFAFVDLILIETSIIFLILITRKINKLSSYLLIPYLLWVTFAGILNFIIAF